MELQRASTFESRNQPLDVSIVMPCLNEVQSLRHCIADAREALDRIYREYGLAGEIVIADNGSSDGSQALAASLGARVVNVEHKGYGAAVLGGFDAAFGQFLVMGDADGSYAFTDSVAMIGRLLDGADLCMGSRFKGGIAAGAMPWKNRYIGNPVLTGVLNLFFRSGIGDAHCGLRAIRKEASQALGLRGSGMELASEMVIKASLKKLHIDETPATLSPDLRDRPPHLRPWRDGWRHLRYLFMLSPTWAFAVPAALMAVLGAMILAFAMASALGLADAGPFGESWTVIGAMLTSTGHLAVLMALAAHLYGVREGYRLPRPWLLGLRPLLTLESCLILGLLLIAGSATGLLATLSYWSDNGFRALPTILPVALAGLAGIIGLQTIFGGVLLAILGGHEADFLRHAAAQAPPPPVNQQLVRIPRYTAVAIFCALVHNAVMIGLDWLGLHYAASQVVSAAVLLPTGYWLTTGHVFGKARNWIDFGRYSVALITNFPVALLLVWLLRDRMALPMALAAPISTIALYIWNYLTSHWALAGRGAAAHG